MASAPKELINRSKTSNVVADYLMSEIFDGRLRSGDRVDLAEVAQALGVSRSPVREALVMLERDGVVSIEHHRGVYVEPFDADSIMDDYEVMGLLSGLAVARLARRRDPELLADLQRLVGELETVPVSQLGDVVQDILRAEHRAGGSRRLRAELRASGGFLPWVFRLSSGQSREEVTSVHRDVVAAIADGDGQRAAQCRAEDFRAAGQRVVADLVSRGVLS